MNENGQLRQAENAVESAEHIYEARAHLFADAEAQAWREWASYQLEQHARANPELILSKSPTELAELKRTLDLFVAEREPHVADAVLTHARTLTTGNSVTLNNTAVRDSLEKVLEVENDTLGAELVEHGFGKARWSENSVDWFALPGQPSPLGNPHSGFRSSSGQEATLVQLAKDVEEARKKRDAIMKQLASDAAAEAWKSADRG